MKLKEAREKSHISIDEAAGVLGITSSEYVELEQHPASMTASDFIVLARLFDVYLDDIFFG